MGYDQTFPIIPQNAIIDVNVGPLPFRITFQVPLRITGSVQTFTTPPILLLRVRPHSLILFRPS